VTSNPRRTRPGFFTTVPGAITIVAIIAALAGLAWVGARSGKAAVAKMRVEVTSCTFAGSTATVGLLVVNNGDAVRDAHIQVQYRDAGGERLDTNETTARAVGPGETVRLEESTILDAPANAGTCTVTRVR
jgi:hypothetical protein